MNPQKHNVTLTNTTSCASVETDVTQNKSKFRHMYYNSRCSTAQLVVIQVVLYWSAFLPYFLNHIWSKTPKRTKRIVKENQT